MNVFCASGFIGKDPEQRAAKTGTIITTFPLPVEQGWGDNKKTTWVKCTLFGKKGAGTPHGLAQYLSKGQLVTIQGEIVLEEWDGKDGTRQKQLCCLVDNIVVPKQARDDVYSNPPQKAAPAPAQDFNDFDDDIPFANPYKGQELMI